MVRKGTELWRWNASECISDGCMMEYVERINWGLNNMMGI